MANRRAMVSPTKRHRHAYKLDSYSGQSLRFRCDCGDLVERKPTKSERQQILEQFKPKPENDVHLIYHDYIKRVDSKKLIGADLICAVEKWAEKWTTVKIISCDDDVHAGSVLVLIPHETDRDWFGMTVVYIPQGTGENSIRFFLYPHHQVNLMTALVVAAQSKKFQNAENGIYSKGRQLNFKWKAK